MARAAITRRPRRWGRRVQLGRHGVQAVVAGFIALAVVRTTWFADASWWLAKPEAFCPFGGFEAAWRWVTSGGTAAVRASSVVLAAAVLATAVVGRSFFCGWMCPLGALQEAIHGVGQRLLGRTPRLRGAVDRLADSRLARVADRWLRLLKYVVLVWAVTGVAVLGVLVWHDVDPWKALITVTGWQTGLGLVVLGLTAVLSLVVPRPWCRYACPLGAALGLASAISPVAVERHGDACLACDRCTRACPMGLAVHELTRVTSPDCIACLECVSDCPSGAGLGVRLALPGRPAEATEPLPVPQPPNERELTGVGS